MMNLISWNINGIRSLRKPIKELLDSFDADIICLQETKITRDQIDECLALIDGYSSYFSFSRKRSGYSGVVTFCKTTACPVSAEEGLSGISIKEFRSDIIGCYGSVHELGHEILQSLDCEGRAVLTQHRVRLRNADETFVVIINVYCPRADPDKPERKEFKLKFYELLQRRGEAILSSGWHVIITGDINTCHKQIDHCDPAVYEDFSNQPDRKWLDQFLLNVGTEDDLSKTFVDTFRYFHPSQRNAFTCWNTMTSARQTNYGTRIDYIFVDVKLCREFMTDSIILRDVQGSDHCPIQGTFDITCVPSTKMPSLASSYWPEFSGKQVKVSSYFKNRSGVLVPDQSYLLSSTDDQLGKRSLPQKDVQKNKKTSFKQMTITGFVKSNSTVSQSDDVSSMCSSQEDTVAHSNGSQDMSLQQQVPDKKCKSANAWKMLLKGPPPLPLCKGHNEPCVVRVVKKPGPNYGRQFYVCARPNGHDGNPEARCQFFQWLNKGTGNVLKRGTGTRT